MSLLLNQKSDLNILFKLSVFLLIGLPACSADLPLGNGCDNGWVRYNSSCFKIDADRTFYALANLICVYNDAKLASISNQETLQFLIEQTRSVDMAEFWIGLQTHGERLIWYDNVDAENQSWVIKGDISQRRNCFFFDGQVVKRGTCSSHNGYICENKVAKPENKSCPEDTKHAHHMNLCLWMSDSPMTKEQAQKSCEERGGSMLDFEGFAGGGLQYLDEFTKADATFWTNITWNSNATTLSLLGNKSHIPLWPTVTSEIDEGDDTMKLFLVADKGACTTLGFYLSSEFPIRLYQVECESSASVICSASPEKIQISSRTTDAPFSPVSVQVSSDFFSRVECPHGYNWKEDKSTGYCYWETSYETARLSWNAARAYCQSYGGDLASFHSVDEERIGLSFQYGTTSHPYWIGLKYDVDHEKFVWVDGSPMDYENWAPDQPDHRDLRMQCVQMDASKKHWLASYCGMLSWFICKAPKQLNPKMPVLPTQEPLQNCVDDADEYFFDGYCYKVFAAQLAWSRAQSYCENKDANLVSVHSEPEVDFLIRLLYEAKHMLSNRVWIGLNSLGLDDQLKWSDRTPLNFVHWSKNEPNNVLNQEKCSSMYSSSGLWNDENCASALPFICKRKNSTEPDTTINVLSTTPIPEPGNCKKGWYSFQDRCYLLMGEKKKDWANFSVASERCSALNGSLASIRDAKDQVFLTFLMQGIKENMWIGLHDTVQSGVYIWTDSSPLTYTNWALGEPSIFRLPEDCVTLVYKHQESGSWKTESCNSVLPYICQSRKDPTVTTPWIPTSTRCIDPDGWLKRGYSCFALFNVATTWLDAVGVCDGYKAKLVSASDFSVQSVVKYMTVDLNASIWIGLLMTPNHSFEWSNGRPMTISNWDFNEPATRAVNDPCFTSSPDGYWKTSDCEAKYPFICQINAEEVPQKERKPTICPTSNWDAIEGDDEYCYHVKENTRGQNAYVMCFQQGGHLVSIHSQEQVDRLKEYLKNVTTRNNPFFIGLSRNKKGGFSWSDDSPVDYENWEAGEPQVSTSTNLCVEMKTQTLTWRVISCSSIRNAVCAVKKEISTAELSATTEQQSEQSAYTEENVPKSLSGGAIAAIIVSLIVVICASVVVYLYFKPRHGMHFRLQTSQVTSFENVLYDANMSMELKDDRSFYEPQA